jgi:hypothetical protein
MNHLTQRSMSRHHKTLILFAFLSALSMAIYILASRYTYRVGFPLDDAWIHQTYARNIKLTGQWSFLPGQPSAGSTAPLWSGLLSLGYFLGLAPYFWTFLLGWLSLWAMAALGERLLITALPSMADKSIWIGIILIFEWHLVWSSASGMETLFFSAMIILIFILLGKDILNWLLIGLLIGIGVWIRPDGVTLLGPALIIIATHYYTRQQRIFSLSRLLLGFILIFCTFLGFNILLSGNPLPNTFFAKQAEYSIYQLIPLWKRYVAQLVLPLVGVGSIIAPGFVIFTVHSLQKKNWWGIACIIWVLGYLFLYALRLPATYQHGRYVIPVMALYFTLSLIGVFNWIRIQHTSLWRRVINASWIVSIPIILLAFWVQGARAYANDVGVIESEMVDTAYWIENNTEEDALIAAHDIGALGYFGNRTIIDLAGLISPEVIPFIRDETRLGQYLDNSGADYLMTFPSWYPNLVQKGVLIYRNQGDISPKIGGENMCVYQWLHRR